MLRKAIIALTGAVAIGGAFATEASARTWGHGGGGFHGVRSGGFTGHRGFVGNRGFAFRHGVNRGRFFRGGVGVGVGYWPGYYAYGYGYDGCYRPRWVMTQWGWQRIRVWVCG